jgi:hypothetical protein
MRVIHSSKGMSKKVWGARYLSKSTVFVTSVAPFEDRLNDLLLTFVLA